MMPYDLPPDLPSCPETSAFHLCRRLYIKELTGDILIIHSPYKMSSRNRDIGLKIRMTYIVRLFCLMQGSLGQNTSPLIAMYHDMARHPAKNNVLVSISHGTYIPTHMHDEIHLLCMHVKSNMLCCGALFCDLTPIFGEATKSRLEVRIYHYMLDLTLKTKGQWAHKPNPIIESIITTAACTTSPALTKFEPALGLPTAQHFDQVSFFILTYAKYI